MPTILEKLKTAVADQTSLNLRIGKQTLGVYCGVKRSRPYWTLTWYEGATRRRKSTTDAEEVITLASSLADSLAAGVVANAAVISQPEDVAKIPINDLLEFYKKHHPNFKEIHNSPRVREVADEFIASCKTAGRSDRHTQTVKHHLKKFCDFYSDRIAKVSVNDIGSYLHTLSSLKTRLNHRITLAAFFHFAQRRGFLPEGESTAVDRSERPSVKPVEPEILSSEDYNKLLKVCKNPKIKAFLVLGGLCGLRSAEIMRLRWENVREDHIVLNASITKTARRRIAEIPGNAGVWLEDIRKETGFVSYQSQAALYEELHSVCNAADVTWKPNALRHSFASYHLEFHRDPPRTSKTAGHSLRMLETVYAKLVSREDASAWFSIFPPPDNRKRDHNEQQPTPREMHTDLSHRFSHAG
jgi:integrase